MSTVSQNPTRLTTGRLSAILRLMLSEDRPANALDGALTDMVAEYYAMQDELAATRSRLGAVLDICDREQRNAIRWENPIPVPEWVAEVQRAALGDDVRKSDGATIDIRDALRMLAGGAA